MTRQIPKFQRRTRVVHRARKMYLRSKWLLRHVRSHLLHITGEARGSSPCPEGPFSWVLIIKSPLSRMERDQCGPFSYPLSIATA